MGQAPGIGMNRVGAELAHAMVKKLVAIPVAAVAMLHAPMQAVMNLRRLRLSDNRPNGIPTTA